MSKYIPIEFIQGAKMNIVSTPDALQAEYIRGWNDCIEAIINNAPTATNDDDGFLSALGTLGMRGDEEGCTACSFDDIYEKLTDNQG